MAALTGELSFASVPAALDQADALIADGQIDLSGVTRTDSAGLALLLELTRRARVDGKQLRLSGAAKQLRDLVKFFELDAALSLEGTR